MTRKLLCIIAGCILSIPFQSMGGTLQVSPTSSGYGSLHQAIREATAGDVIEVQPGTFYESNILINKKLTLIGKDFPVIDARDTAEGFIVDADSVTIRGFMIRNVATSYITDRAGIRINARSHCRIEQNRIVNTFFGIYLKHARYCTVAGNEITGVPKDEASTGNAIHVWYSNHISIENNTCRSHRDGIYLEFADNSTISGNNSENNLRYGLHFMFSNNDTYSKNVFRMNGAGVAVMYSRNISMRANLFERNRGSSSYGLLLKDILDGDITGNSFVDNTIGIYADGSNRISYQNNTFSRNGWAIKILGSCIDNTVTGNNFLGNTFDVMTNSRMNSNTFDGNYWSSYSGYDLDRNGVGDVPYRPVRLFSYIVGNVPASIVLLRSFFVELVNFAEQITPVITPPTLEDRSPLMKMMSL